MNKTEIVSFRIKNFRSLKDVEIELKPNVYLFGSNGSGKSSILKAITFFSNYLINIINYDLLSTDPYIYLVKSALRLNEYSVFNSYKEIVINNNTSENIEIITTISNYRIILRRLSDIPISNFLDRFAIEGIPLDPIDLPLDYISEIIKDQQKQKPNLDPFEEIGEEVKNSTNSNFRVSFIFKQSKDEYDLLKEIQIEDLDQNFIFSFTPRRKDSQNNPYPHLESRVQFSVVNEETQFIQEFLESELSFLPLFNPTRLSSIDIEGTIVRELHSFFKRNDHSSKDNILKKLSGNDKGLLFEKILQITDKLFIHFPKKITSLYSELIYIPSIRELPKHSYPLSGGRFSDKDYMGIIRRLDEDIFIPKLKEEINNCLVDHFNFSEIIDIQKEELSGCIFTKDIKSGSASNFSNSSSGIQQLLPIIFYLLDREHPDSLFLCEQPELHLHPKLQTLLASFLVKKNFWSKIKIIETHSEHIIRKIQTLLAKGEIEKEDITVYYFYKDKVTGDTVSKKMELDDNGFFKEPWPDEFFDDSFNLSMELLTAKKN